MIKDDKEKAIVFLEKAIELDSKFIEESKKETIFIPIKVYISDKSNNNIEKEKEYLSTIENNVIKHLETTGSVVENLSDLKYKVRMQERENNRKNTLNKDKER